MNSSMIDMVSPPSMLCTMPRILFMSSDTLTACKYLKKPLKHWWPPNWMCLKWHGSKTLDMRHQRPQVSSNVPQSEGNPTLKWFCHNDSSQKPLQSLLDTWSYRSSDFIRQPKSHDTHKPREVVWEFIQHLATPTAQYGMEAPNLTKRSMRDAQCILLAIHEQQQVPHQNKWEVTNWLEQPGQYNQWCLCFLRNLKMFPNLTHSLHKVS